MSILTDTESNDAQPTQDAPGQNLELCPFCPDGGRPFFYRSVNGTLIARVGCSQCGFSIKCAVLGYQDDAPLSRDIVSVWNTRRAHGTEAGDWNERARVIAEQFQRFTAGDTVDNYSRDVLANWIVALATDAHKAGMPQWRPIETAPTGREAFLVYCPERKNIYEVFHWENDLRFVIWASGGRILDENPTLWMPLDAIRHRAGGTGEGKK